MSDFWENAISLRDAYTVQDPGLDFLVVTFASRELFVVDRRGVVHAAFQPWHSGLAAETMDRLNVRRLAGRG